MDRVDIRRPDGPGVLFRHEELACRATGVVRLAPGFGEALASLRMIFGRPMIVTSCCRSEAHNRAVGGHPRSLHVYDHPYWPTGGTCAIDIKATDPTYRTLLARLAMDQGWSVGVASTFLHLDRRDFVGLPQNIFDY
jgi:hypothetical protein